MHPTRCRAFDESPGGPEDYFSSLVAIAEEGIMLGKVVAIGECGLGENFALRTDEPLLHPHEKEEEY